MFEPKAPPAAVAAAVAAPGQQLPRRQQRPPGSQRMDSENSYRVQGLVLLAPTMNTRTRVPQVLSVFTTVGDP
jgi:hypothetical protein